MIFDNIERLVQGESRHIEGRIIADLLVRLGGKVEWKPTEFAMLTKNDIPYVFERDLENDIIRLVVRER